MPNEYLRMWVGKHLTTTIRKNFTAEDHRRIAEFIKSDGCTGVPDWFLNGCIQHDWGFRTHRDFEGNWVTEHEVNGWLKEYVQKRSWLGRWSLVAFVRYQFLEKLLPKRVWDSLPEEVED
jgi:hypothetical protein